MNNKELYKSAFSHLHSSAEISMEAFSAMNKKHGFSKKAIISVAAVAAVLGFSMTAFAANIFGVRDLVMSGTRQVVTPGGDVYVETLISMQGYPESNEYKAAAEWSAFTSTYDEDGSVLASVGNGTNEYVEAYPEYLVYSEEMVDKLEEILAKYDLQVYTSTTVADSETDFYAMAGKGDVMAPAGDADAFSFGYVRSDGSFMFEGSTAVSDAATIDYQFSNSSKGTFSDVYLNIGDVSSYTEWEYATASGKTVSLALGADKSLVVASFDKSFVLVNILNGFNTITADELEHFADMIDFSVFE